MKQLRIFLYLFLASHCIVPSILAQSLCITWPNAVFQPTPNPITHEVAPDYGIYWFKQEGNHEVAMRAFAPPSLVPQFSNGTINTLPKQLSLAQAKARYIKLLEQKGLFNPHYPTLLFIHGDQPTTTAKRKRMDFCYTYLQTNQQKAPLIHLLPEWHHWNMGIFYWNQFADDANGTGLIALIKAVLYPEMKIYSAHNEAAMQWTYLNNKGDLTFCHPHQQGCAPLPASPQGQTLSVRDILYQSYLNALPDNYHQPIRILGQSLGAQLAIQLTNRIENNRQLEKPSALILVEPYFTPNLYRLAVGANKTSSVSNYNDDMTRHFLKKDPALALMLYRTTQLSEWPTGNHNVPLEHLAAYLQICPTFLNNAYATQRTIDAHISAAYIYFYSKHAAANHFISAQSSPAAIRTLMGTTHYCNLIEFNKGCEQISSKPLHCAMHGFF